MKILTRIKYHGYNRSLLRVYWSCLVGTAIGFALKTSPAEFVETIAYLTFGTLLLPPAEWLLVRVWSGIAALRRRFKRKLTLRTYDPRSVKLTFNGVELTGFHDGTPLVVERQLDKDVR